MSSDLLYKIFENHLFNALVEDETTEDFVARVISDYLDKVARQGMLPYQHLADIETDLRDEVLEMFRKKTYGHYSLSTFRKAHAEKTEARDPSPRPRRIS